MHVEGGSVHLTQREIDEQALREVETRCVLENAKSAAGNALTALRAADVARAVEALRRALALAESLAALAATAEPVASTGKEQR